MSSVRALSLSLDSENELLSALPGGERDRLLSKAQHVTCKAGSTLLSYDRSIRSLDFITGGLASAFVTMEGGKSVEVGCIGREGIVGLGAAMGYARSFYACCMLIDGSAWRVPVAEAQKVFQDSGRLQVLLRRYVVARLVEISQSAACNVLHSLEQRLARWLLTAADRTGSDQLALTHEYLSSILGARRSTVSLAAGHLERQEFISYKRGHVRILDTPGLQRAACECYSIVRQTFAETTAL